jgi:hypothetical protein
VVSEQRFCDKEGKEAELEGSSMICSFLEIERMQEMWEEECEGCGIERTAGEPAGLQ